MAPGPGELLVFFLFKEKLRKSTNVCECVCKGVCVVVGRGMDKPSDNIPFP